MVKVNQLRVKKFNHKNPICQTCKTETTEIGRVGTGRFTACRKCDPSLFAELERMGLIKEWKMFTGAIEVTIEAETEELAEERLKIFTEQVIEQNADVYKTRYVLPKKNADTIKMLKDINEWSKLIEADCNQKKEPPVASIPVTLPDCKLTNKSCRFDICPKRFTVVKIVKGLVAKE